MHNFRCTRACCFIALLFLASAPARAQKPQILPPAKPEKSAITPVQTPQSYPTADAARSGGVLRRVHARFELQRDDAARAPGARERERASESETKKRKTVRLLFAKGYGYSDVAKRKPVIADETMFRPGSVSKLFTWTAVMQQVQAGKLDLDRDVNDYLDFKIPEKFGKPITLRNIMTHTPGFEEGIHDAFVKNAKDLYPLGDYMKKRMPDRIYPPGQVVAYSNYGASLAGYIVQRVSGEQYADYIANHILKPLGMEHIPSANRCPTI